MANKQKFDEPKERHNISLTETAWNGLQLLANQHGFGANVSGYLEYLGRLAATKNES